MVHDLSAAGQHQDPARRQDWSEVYARLNGRDHSALSAADLEALADAAWWLCRVDESLSARQSAYAAYVTSDDARRAGYNAWMLAVEYRFIGKPTLAAGWLAKARRSLGGLPTGAEHGFLAYTEAELAESDGDLDTAVALARKAVEIGRSCQSRDVVTMGLHQQGRLLVEQGRLAEGLALIDEAMCDAVSGQLSDLVTGWTYCIAVAVCFDLGDLRRAGEWNDAAMAWCDSLPAGTPFHGLCRVHRAELTGLRGTLERASVEADRACAELMSYHPQMAAESFYVAGELRRRMGDLPAAEDAFIRAHELGRDPQPGLALLRLAHGEGEVAARALASCLASGAWSPLVRIRLLAAQVEVGVAIGNVNTARQAADELAAMQTSSTTAVLAAAAATAEGAVQLAEQEAAKALEWLRRARGLWLELDLPYEAARARMLIASASRAVDDHEAARLELRAARATFELLGADVERRSADELLEDDRAIGRHLPAGLTAREVDVLRLVATGKTNRDIAHELVLSQHTVARHLNNIFAKLGVSSRAAATAFAYTHDLV